jgi:ATP synthase protein I
MRDEKLRRTVDEQLERTKRARLGQSSLLARTVYLGSIGIMMAIPIVAGAYLGRWLDAQRTGFSFSWTVSLILIGVFVGAANVVLFVRQTWA